MESLRALMRLVTVVLGIAFVSCDNPEAAEKVGDTALLEVIEVDTVIFTQSGLLGYVNDMAIDSDGNLYIGDSQTEQVLQVAREAGRIRTFGGPGQGPKEFKNLGTLRVVGAEIWVLDSGNGRLQRLTLEGEYIGQARVNRSAGAGAAAHLRTDGGMLVSSWGTDTALVREFDADGLFVRKIGDPVVIAPMFWDIADMKVQIARGEVPDEIRNANFVVGDDEGGLWVALRSEAEVRRYERDGTLAWTTVVDEPELTAAKQQFFERNAAMESPMSFVALSYFADGHAVGDRLWLLLETELGGDAVLLVVGPEGQTERRVRVHGAGGAHRVLVDPLRREVWLATRDDAQLLRAKLGNGGE